MNVELLKLLLLTPFLIFASYEDIKIVWKKVGACWKRTHNLKVSNRVWKYLLICIVIILILNIKEVPSIFLSLPLIFAFVFILFWFGIIGAADGKLLILMSMLYPKLLEVRNIVPFTIFELVTSEHAVLSFNLPFVLIVFLNASVISFMTVIPIYRNYDEIKKLRIPFIPFITIGFFATLLIVNL